MEGESSVRKLVINPDDNTRSRTLKQNVGIAVEKCLESWKCANLAKCFPALVMDGNNEYLKELELQMGRSLRNNLYPDVQDLLDKKGQILDNFHDKMKNTIDEAPNREGPAWRPTNDPTVDMLAIEADMLRHERDRLKIIVEKENIKINELMECVKIGRTECEANQAALAQESAVLQGIEENCGNIMAEYAGNELDLN